MVNSLPTNGQPKVLVSFRNIAEVQAVFDEEIAVFDLKEPSRGSLGRPDLAVVEQFAGVLRARLFQDKMRHRCRLGVALGECFGIRDGFRSVLESTRWREALASYDYVKIGLSKASQQPNWIESWKDVFDQFSAVAQLVPVAYADGKNHGAPSIDEVLEMAIGIRKQIDGNLDQPFTMLIDTFDKTNGRLFSHLDSHQLSHWIARANRHGIRIGVAGSLTLSDIGPLTRAKTELIGLRGAVCASGERTNSVDVRLVRNFLSAVKRPPEDK